VTALGTMLSIATGKPVIQINSQINVDNLHNTSHSTVLTSPTAKAELRPDAIWQVVGQNGHWGFDG
jgi:hypothetical protein